MIKCQAVRKELTPEGRRFIEDLRRHVKSDGYDGVWRRLIELQSDYPVHSHMTFGADFGSVEIRDVEAEQKGGTLL